jgi:hypothetical protein
VCYLPVRPLQQCSSCCSSGFAARANYAWSVSEWRGIEGGVLCLNPRHCFESLCGTVCYNSVL